MSKIFKAFLVLLAIFVAVLGILGGYQTSQKFKYPVAYADYIVEYDYMDPETNIRFGCHYLRHLIDVYGNIDTALAAYNGGMGNVYSWLNDSRYSDDGVTLKYIPFSETRNYVVKVNSSWEHYKEMYQ